MKSLIVGYGHAGSYHEKYYPSDVQVLGIVDIDQRKLNLGSKKGYRTFSSLKEALNILDKEEVNLYSVCTPTEFHFKHVKRILEFDSQARIILEKPPCLPHETDNMLSLVNKYPKSKIVVNERYISSYVTLEVKKLVEELDLVQPEIEVEFSKNRIKDILEGRFLDYELGVLGYEGPHMVSLVSGVIKDSYPKRIITSRMGSMILPRGKFRDGKNILEYQGWAEIKYLTNNDSNVYFFTAMDGRIGIRLKEVNAPTRIPFGDETRYRILRVSKNNVEIIGQYEPISGLERGMGRIVMKRGKDIKRKVVNDNNWKTHIKRSVNYLKGEEENPAPVKRAVNLVKFLHEAIKLSKNISRSKNQNF